MAFLSLSLYDTPEPTNHMNVLFLRPGDFPVSNFIRYLMERFKSSFKKFYSRYGDLIQQYAVSLSQMSNDILTLNQLQ